MRFSLRWLFVAVAFAAIGCFSLANASSTLEGAWAAATCAFLVLSVVGASYSRRDQRPFWVGCLISGCSYLAAAHLPEPLSKAVHLLDSGLDNAHELVIHDAVVDAEIGARFGGVYMDDGRILTRWPPKEHFIAIGRLLGAFLSASVGGIVAIWFDARSRKASATAH
ncbi:MAG TPA: hypothetical protein VHC22_29515 [Pirellulales bacterium]|nr:hypothetical protein [Pirellulales bacterium]